MLYLVALFYLIVCQLMPGIILKPCVHHYLAAIEEYAYVYIVPNKFCR